MQAKLQSLVQLDGGQIILHMNAGFPSWWALSLSWSYANSQTEIKRASGGWNKWCHDRVTLQEHCGNFTQTNYESTHKMSTLVYIFKYV